MLCASILAVSPGVATAQERRTAAVDGPMATVNAFIAAQTAFDRATLDRIVANDFVEFSPIGAVDDRATFLSFYDAARKPAVSVDVSGSQPLVRVGRDDAFVSMVLTTKVNGSPRGSGVRAGYALRKTERRWRLTTAQYTPIRAPAAP